MIRGWKPGWLLALGLLTGVGCHAGRPAIRSSHRPAGTTRMVDTLAALYRNALAQYQRYPYLNRRRADAIEEMIKRQSGVEALRNLYFLAQERLRAGQTREAIAALERHLNEAGVS